MRKGLITLIFLILGIVLFIFTLRNVGTSKVVESLNLLSGPQSIFVFIALLLGQVVIGAIRWKVIIGPTKDEGLKFSKILMARWAGFAVSFLTPSAFFGGEPVRYFILREESKLSPSKIISSIILDKLIFFLMQCIFFFLGVFFILLYLNLSWLYEIIMLGILLLAAAAFWVLLRKTRNISYERGLFTTMTERFYLSKLKIVKKSQEKLERIEEEMRAFLRSPRVLKVMGLAVIESSFVFLAFWLIMVFAGNYLEIPKLFAIRSMTDLSYTFPFPAALGVLEISQAFLFKVLGFDVATGVAFSLILRGLDLIIAFFGLLILCWMQMRFIIRKITIFFKLFVLREKI